MKPIKALVPLIIVLILAALIVSFGFSINRLSGIVILLVVTVTMVTWYVLQRKRKSAIMQLSTQLRRILSGDYHLDIQTYEEGELAVLSADIYKLVTAFREQSILLKKDKTWLADSISDISHQLKTPITSMLMLTDLLKKDLEESRRKQFLQQLSAQTDRLQWLVKNLLTLSKLDALAIVYRKAKFPMGELIELASEPLLISMELKNQTLSVTGALDQELSVDGDWLAEALTNILKNATEHAPMDSGITVEAHDLPMSRMISVTNEGVISPIDLPHIFTRFYRGRQSAKDSIGIGLAISQAIVQQQGGSIEANTTDTTTTFMIRFPK